MGCRLTWLFAALAAGLLACGLTVSGSGEGSEVSPTQTPPEVIEPETRVTTFSCGGETCSAETQVCCASADAATSCMPTATGCPSVDGGVAPNPLACTSYTACPERYRCCYEPGVGASCKERCDRDEGALCHVGEDGCESSALDCVPMNAPPAPSIGLCRYTGEYEERNDDDGDHDGNGGWDGNWNGGNRGNGDNR